jgi:hypothetical protein
VDHQKGEPPSARTGERSTGVQLESLRTRTFVLVAATGAIVAVAVIDTLRESPPRPRLNATTTTTGPAATAVHGTRDCTDASPSGPWVYSCRGEWVRAFVRVAGFRVVEETGSAWIARGRGSIFYIWATHNTIEWGHSCARAIGAP